MKKFQHNALTSRANLFHMRVFTLIKRLASLIPWSLVLTAKMNLSVFLNILSSFLDRDYIYSNGSQQINTIFWEDTCNNDHQKNWKNIQDIHNINLYSGFINVAKNFLQIFSYISIYFWSHWEMKLYNHCKVCKVKRIKWKKKSFILFMVQSKYKNSFWIDCNLE